MKNQGKQERKSKPSTLQQASRGLGGRIKARNRSSTRKIDYKQAEVKLSSISKQT